MQDRGARGLAGVFLAVLVGAVLSPSFLVAAEPSIAQLRAQIAEQEAKLSDLRQVEEQRHKAGTADVESAAELRTQIAEQEAKLSDLRQRLRQAEEQQHRLELTEDRLIQQQRQLGEVPVLQARVAKVRADLQEVRRVMAGLDQELKAAEGRLAALKSAFDAARQREEAARQAEAERRAKEKAARQAEEDRRAREARRQRKKGDTDGEMAPRKSLNIYGCPLDSASVEEAMSRADKYYSAGDYRRASACYRFAAERGDQRAQFYLNIIKAQGHH